MIKPGKTEKGGVNLSPNGDRPPPPKATKPAHTHIPAAVVRKIENRVLALHYAVLADLIATDRLTTEQLVGVLRGAAERFELAED